VELIQNNEKIIYRIDIPVSQRKTKSISGASLSYGKNFPVLIGLTDYGYTPVKIGVEYDFALGRAYDFDIPFKDGLYGFQTAYGDPIYFREEPDGSISYEFQHGGKDNYVSSTGEFLAPYQVRIIKKINQRENIWA
jgi:hypothetical protein